MFSCRAKGVKKTTKGYGINYKKNGISFGLNHNNEPRKESMNQSIEITEEIKQQVLKEHYAKIQSRGGQTNKAKGREYFVAMGLKSGEIRRKARRERMKQQRDQSSGNTAGNI